LNIRTYFDSVKVELQQLADRKLHFLCFNKKI